jgi:hypothetical protein
VDAVVALGRLAAVEVDDLGKTLAGDFDAVFGSGEDGGGVRIGLAGLAVEDEACTTFGAGVLGEQKDAGVGALGGGAVAEPCGERNAEGEFGGDGAHVEDDGAESSRLKEQVGSAEGLIEASPGLADRARSRAPDRAQSTELRAQERRHPMSDGWRQGENFSGVLSDFWLWLGATGGEILADGRCHYDDGGTILPARRRNRRIFRGISGAILSETGEGELLGLGAAADPEQAVEVDTDGCGGFGMKSVGDIDPGADATCICEAGDKGERERGAAGAFGSGEFGDGADGQTSAEGVIECGDAGRHGGANDARRWSERGRDAVGKGSFDLLAEGGGGRHTNYFRLIFAYQEGLEQGGFAQRAK